MHRLPPLVHDSGEWHLPLTGPTALALCQSLVSDDTANLSQALQADPALALWTSIRAAATGVDRLETFDALAEWLAPRLMAELRSLPSAELPRSQLSAFATLAAAGTVLRDRVADKDRDPSALLLAMLHNASDWLKASATAKSVKNPLPTWLVDALQSVRQVRGGSATVQAVRRAIRLHTSKTVHQRQLGNARRAWLGSQDTVAALMPPLIHRLDRLDTLERSFAERLETEKLESLAEFAAGTGHEMNNPLAVISGRAQLFLRQESDPERRRELALINTQAMRVHEMIADLMLFARPPQVIRESCDLVALVSRAADEVRRKAAEQGTTVEFDAAVETFSIEVDAGQLSVALLAVCDNALNALGQGGCVTLSLESHHDFARITIHDDGPGIPSDVRRHLFDPFFSGRSAGRGLGNGLSKCWRIVTNHGGSIDVESPSGQGTSITIELPTFAAAK